MSHTISTRLLQALENLSGNDLEKFCFHLRDRREEPKIRRGQVDEKSPVKITGLLVSTFTEPGALKVVLETLRLIDCNQEAQTLESKTKACVDKGDPKTSNGKLDRKPLQEVENYADGKFPLKAAQQGGAPVKMVKQEEVADHQREGEPSVSQSPMTAQKVLGEVRFQRGVDRAKERSLQPGQEGVALVGFGRHETETLKDLYESKDKDRISYVHFLRGMKSTCDPGTKMDAAIRYILQRDRGRAAAATATRNRQSNRNQYASSSRPKVNRT
ncbi:uncharacterized protein LOC117777216 isoform X3 [Hippoglossus hippoglossus]|uniref:uncharacterized protein LOC117777216 isoform X3 n=1 Tax=Hippoglossus hippoglossus TaxID=8267 RepID=UPI00148D0A09|nr:uncharacterized protein LOC117777216 isoform X3 [Hippoglossus hippoglossus]